MQADRHALPSARPDGLKPNTRIGPRHPRLGAAGFRVGAMAGGARPWALRAFISSARISPMQRIARVREKLARGETVYLAGLGAARHAQFRRGAGRGDAGERPAPDRQQRGRALFRQQAHHRISASVDRRDGRDAARHGPRYRRYRRLAHQLGLSDAGRHAGPLGAGGSCRRACKLLRTTEAAGFDGRRLDQMTRTPKILARQLGLAERVPLICMPHHDNHAWFSYAASPFADDGEPVAIAVLDGTGDQRLDLALRRRERRDAAALLQRQHVQFARRLLQRDLVDAGRLDLAVQRRPLHGRRRLGRHGPRQQSAITRG